MKTTLRHLTLLVEQVNKLVGRGRFGLVKPDYGYEIREYYQDGVVISSWAKSKSELALILKGMIAGALAHKDKIDHNYILPGGK